MKSLPEIVQANRRLEIDARVTQAERAKLADEYEKCFRKILRQLRRIDHLPAHADTVFSAVNEIEREIEKVYKP